MSDLIDRQAAIDAIEHITSSMSVCVNTDECHGMKRMQRQAVIELANLPSAQPGITLESAIDYLHSIGWMQEHDRTLTESAQPEIIRCKDCKHWTQSMGKMKGYGLGRCDFHDADLVTCNGYCYWAERRTDG